ncbi:hypothetical protein psal_cds_1334 [Pandoravirus salinus]|uniref:F-box domain containing protein n=1 Tax=Pandoravirus salinus TaxID=1349410 RepID=S4W4S0_9VIRU|nr:hypothetical protein psal_cds_1334 [Pandoravirus salinus]AGO85722.2 hypothetical protein psal_cds_1334 [Pandoravirus salinus]
MRQRNQSHDKRHPMEARKRRSGSPPARQNGRTVRDDAKRRRRTPTAPLPTGIDDLPNEMLVHLLACGPTGGDRIAFMLATRMVARRWRNAVEVLWPVPQPYAYGRCLQFLLVKYPDALRGCHTKPDVLHAALVCAERDLRRAGPRLSDDDEPRPYDYASALFDAFYRAAGVRLRQIEAERCPACARKPMSCECMCDCERCGGQWPADDCEQANAPHWVCDYPIECRRSFVVRHRGALVGDGDDSHYEADSAALSRWARCRSHELPHWAALGTSITAKTYIGRCVQLLLCHSVVNASDITRMSCAAVIRRAHSLDDYLLRHRGRRATSGGPLSASESTSVRARRARVCEECASEGYGGAEGDAGYMLGGAQFKARCLRK